MRVRLSKNILNKINAPVNAVNDYKVEFFNADKNEIIIEGGNFWIGQEDYIRLFDPEDLKNI